MIRTANTTHCPMKVYDNDHIGKLLLEGSYYEQDLISIALNNSGKEGMAIDIGAHVGCHAVVYAKHFKEVHAFEPQNHLYRLLKHNLGELARMKPPIKNKAVAHNIAIGHTEGDAFIDNTIKDKEESINYGSRSIKLNGDNVVQMRTLDSFNFTHVRLIKIDVEGAEKLVFWGARKTIETYKPTLLFEYDKVNDFMDKFHVYGDEVRKFDVLDFLLDTGYSRFYKFSKNVLAICSA